MTVADGRATATSAVHGTAELIGTDAARLVVRRSILRWHPYLDGTRLGGRGGMASTAAEQLAKALERLVATTEVAGAVAYHHALVAVVREALDRQRWIPAEVVDDLRSTRPPPGLSHRLAGVDQDLALTAAELEAVWSVDEDLDARIARTNEEVLAAELISHRHLFDTIERSPLTDEQARAVVCFDNRVQVLAAAGSGKTSVMVGRAAYAVARGFVAPDRVLLLAFNKGAANELRSRIDDRFERAGLDATGITVSTFHAFGLEVIGRSTGRKPRPAPWLDQGGDTAAMLEIADELRDRSETFRYRWDLYRLLFGRTSTDVTGGEPDSYDPATATTGYRTFAGEVVKSHGERLIADFLYLNGVTYEYERPYDVDLADADHAQYHPDFYYPEIGVWHEHWALGRDGRPPAEFADYTAGIDWKREVHAAHGTKLIETTWGGVVHGAGLEDLRWELEGLGLTLDWNPDRPTPAPPADAMEHEDLVRLLRTFQQHVKSNRRSPADIEHRLATDQAPLDGLRSRLFLDIFWAVHTEWESRLAAHRHVDFDDMLVQAADHLAAGTDAAYDLIMVDEFQDASQARAGLVRNLLNRPGQFLLTVGDDWQSINRFAGSDLSVMTRFHEQFGRGPQLALTTTFRCSQTICDVARTFVGRNPHQFAKAMRSIHPEQGPPITIIQAEDSAAALAAHLDELGRTVAADQGERHRTTTVQVLGRYRFQRDLLPRRIPENLEVTFHTIHGAKGLEADHVVLPAMTAGRFGFPSSATDDPVLRLALPSPESFPDAEERRLLYVALTRARRQVTLIAPADRMSRFVVELLGDPRVALLGGDRAPVDVQVCRACHRGTMVERRSRYGPFLGCSTFPTCRSTQRLPS